MFLPTFRRLTPVETAAGALLAVAGAATAVWATTSVADEWMPGIATSAFFVAITITVVERAIRREADARLAPRVERALVHIRIEFTRFVEAVAVDYATTHLSNAKPIPADALGLMDLWLAEQGAEDAEHIELDPEARTLRDLAHEFVQQVDQYDARDRDVLEPELVAAIRDLHGASQHARFWEGRRRRTVRPAEIARLTDPTVRSYRLLVAGVRTFGEVLSR